MIKSQKWQLVSRIDKFEQKRDFTEQDVYKERGPMNGQIPAILTAIAEFNLGVPVGQLQTLLQTFYTFSKPIILIKLNTSKGMTFVMINRNGNCHEHHQLLRLYAGLYFRFTLF